MNKKIDYKSIVLAFRPKTLTAAIIPCSAGTALSFAVKQSWSISVFLYALFSSIFIQIGTNLVNDAIDFKKGADNEKRIGPQRITQAGILSSKQVMILATLFFFAALILGIPLVINGGWPIVWIGLLSILLGYGYTAGPFPLAYKGLGDLFVILFFGIVAIGGIFYLHTKSYRSEALILGLQIGFHATVLIAINNLRDIHGDRLVNKKTLAVRLGIESAKKEIYLLCLLPFILNLFWLLRGYNFTVLLSTLSIPLAFKISKNIKKTDPSPIYNQFLAQSAALHALFGILLSLGLIIDRNYFMKL